MREHTPMDEKLESSIDLEELVSVSYRKFRSIILSNDLVRSCSSKGFKIYTRKLPSGTVKHTSPNILRDLAISSKSVKGYIPSSFL